MIIAFYKDGTAARHISGGAALQFFRAFRAEMWRSGVQRDPQAGDEILGVRIVSLTI